MVICASSVPIASRRIRTQRWWRWRWSFPSREFSAMDDMGNENRALSLRNRVNRAGRQRSNGGKVGNRRRPEVSGARRHVCLWTNLLQKSKVASVRIFGEIVKREAIDDSVSLSRVTEPRTRHNDHQAIDRLHDAGGQELSLSLRAEELAGFSRDCRLARPAAGGLS
jgi:hypothetical protein